MVTKNRSYTVDTSFVTWDYTQVGNNPLPPLSVTNRHVTCLKSMTHSGRVPNWKYLIQHGMGATSGFQGQISQFTTSPGKILFHYVYTDLYGGPVQKSHSERTGILVGEPSAAYPGSISTTEAQNLAKIKFLRKCLATQQKLQGLVVAGELAETLKMIRNPAKALFNGVLNYAYDVKRRVNRSKPHNRRRVIANTWLEYAYGWAPLVSDIRSGMEALHTMSINPPPYQHIVAEHSIDSMPSPPVTFQTGSGLYNKYETSFSKSTARCVFRGTVKCDPPSASRTRKLFGVSWSQVLPTVWELIPYSFLVDYFSNVGAVLDANSFNQAYLMWYQMTVIRSNEVTNVLNACVPTLSEAPGVGYYTSRLSSGGSATAIQKLVDRSPGQNAIVPTLALRVPFCDTQWLNIAALAEARR